MTFQIPLSWWVKMLGGKNPHTSNLFLSMQPLLQKGFKRPYKPLSRAQKLQWTRFWLSTSQACTILKDPR